MSGLTLRLLSRPLLPGGANRGDDVADADADALLDPLTRLRLGLGFGLGLAEDRLGLGGPVADLGKSKTDVSLTALLSDYPIAVTQLQNVL